jgi:hypothetical protein
MARSTASDKPLSRRVLVEIDRDMTAKTSKVLWQHEIPIVEALLGEGKVKLLDPASLDEGYNPKVAASMLPYNKQQDPIQRPSETAGIGFVFIGDARTEHARLSEVYGRINDREGAVAAEKVYGRFQEGRFAQLLGSPTLEDLPAAQLRSLIESYGFAPPGANRDMGDAERDEAVKARRDFLAADHATLVKLATQAGVEIG